MRNVYLLLLGAVLWLGLGIQHTQGQNLTVPGFNGASHSGANVVTESVTFPADNSQYSQILMHFDLDCPTGGCDPWDRYSDVKVEVNGVEYEIARYVTPYALSTCNWTLDVTEYRDLLKGTVDLKSYIETWSNGWLFNADFEFVMGTPQYENIYVENLWVDYFLIYGDTLFYSINLPEQTRTVPMNAEKTVVRIVNTGHGQGNTQNAAEFSNMTHEIRINGQQAFTQNLWKADCAQNPCANQPGTWQFARAGWCPGQEVQPDDYDITSLVTPGQPVAIDYVLEPYYNQCSPWNPSCTNGQTCTECTYNGGAHTQPNYKISAQLIHYSTTPFVNVEAPEAIRLEVAPNPTEGKVQLDIQLDRTEMVHLSVFDLQGRQVKAIEPMLLQSRQIDLDLSDETPGVYLLKVDAGSQSTFKKIIVTQ